MKAMSAEELRRAYLDFFISKGHKEIPSASLVPENDPTVLFTTSGMHPLVPYLLGEPHPLGRRLCSVQKCVRTGDIDEVGDNTHLTFFEMLGNWSLGDYFKEDAIKWSFEFLTKILEIPIEKLAVSYFKGDDLVPSDDESKRLWEKNGIPAGRIQQFDRKDNWWGPVGQTGPCGPDSEMFYWTGEGNVPEVFDPENDKEWVEIWNDVFMQYNKTSDGSFELLDRPNIDTGMGFERMLAILNGKASVYDTELFVPIINAVEYVTNRSYALYLRDIRIVADHVRTATMMIADGVQPANKDQGYVLRRLIRRASIMLSSGLDRAPGNTAQSFIAESCMKTLENAYPALTTSHDNIIKTITEEETRFEHTLEKGLREFEKIFEKNKSISGVDAFNLYQSFGFPWEQTEELARKKGHGVNREAFQNEFLKHQETSRVGAEHKFAGGLADNSEEVKKLHTATHLLHQALRIVLGSHVAQKGSNITAERLRFDFSHPEKMSAEQLKAVEDIVNEQISKNLPMGFEMLSVEEAKEAGAIGLFENKYEAIGGKVKVYTAGNEEKGVFSKEICGGPHADNTGSLGRFKIIKEEAVSSGMRRIKAVLTSPA